MLKGILTTLWLGTGALIVSAWSHRKDRSDVAVNVQLPSPESEVPIRATLKRTWQDWVLAFLTPIFIVLLGWYLNNLSSKRKDALLLEEQQRQQESLLALTPNLIDEPAKQRTALGLLWELGHPCFATQFAAWNPSPAAIPAMTRLIREADSAATEQERLYCVDEAKYFLSDFFYSQRTAIFRVRSYEDNVLQAGVILDLQGTAVLAVRPSVRNPAASAWDPIPPQRLLHGVGPCNDTGWAPIDVELWEGSVVAAEVRCPPLEADPANSSRAPESNDLMWFRLTAGRYTTLTPAALPPVQRNALVLAVNIGPNEPRPVEIVTVSEVTGSALKVELDGRSVFSPFLFNTDGELIGVKGIDRNEYLRIDKLLAYGPEDL